MTGKTSQLTLKEMRHRLLKLSEKQAELRQRLNDHLERSEDTLGTLARLAGTNWVILNELRQCARCIVSGQSLVALCAYLGIEELGNETAELAEPVPDRFRGLSVLPVNILNLVFDILDAHRTYEKTYDMRMFSSAFGSEYAEMVLGVLNQSRAECMKLADPNVQEAIIDVLLDENFEARLEAAKAEVQAEKASELAIFKPLLEQLLERHGSKLKVSKLLGVSPSSVHSAFRGEASVAHIQRLISGAELLLSENPDDPSVKFKYLYRDLLERYETQTHVADALGVPRSTLRNAISGIAKLETLESLFAKAAQLEASGPEAEQTEAETSEDPPTSLPQPPAETPQATDPIPPGWETVAGTTTEQGVRFVLTADSFQQLQDVPLTALRECMRTTLEAARITLIIGSQLDDKAARDMLRDENAWEIEELSNAIKTFGFAHPDRLVPVYDDQRAMQAKQAQDHQSPGGGRSHQ